MIVLPETLTLPPDRLSKTCILVPNLAVCSETRFASGFMSMSCFLVAFLCVGMGFGGYIDDNFTFAFYWIAHAIPAVGGYTSCTFLVPIARFSETGVACASLAPVAGSIIQVVYIVHAGLYWCYVCNMVAVTYFSFVKPTFKISINPTVALGLLALAEALVFGKLYEIGAFDSSPECVLLIALLIALLVALLIAAPSTGRFLYHPQPCELPILRAHASSRRLRASTPDEELMRSAPSTLLPSRLPSPKSKLFGLF